MSGNGSAPKAVLIVEDAETCASTLEILFSSIRGLEILMASSAEQAWQMLERRAANIRAIVTDLHMPGMDGFDLIDRVRSDQRHSALPILVITGSTDPDVPGRLRRHGVEAVFAKPYSPALVREKLEQLLSDDMHGK
ncbi:MAG TPA: response regulator [Bryobacteraceae bacterium]|nr:response regulator [Bryobacteraceae bacterium]